jgi:hypothetical protein
MEQARRQRGIKVKAKRLPLQRREQENSIERAVAVQTDTSTTAVKLSRRNMTLLAAPREE